ncbi:pentatricopeptide repeat-containing protein at5g46460 mitochondrial [Phtheirospermum japonicum]|uniref:Pentatricopeptide repeat-containing protein at5g46460 mitochondrial n=1 Tax=Phtheirospermum japonicum TaxID=374723 RepID=A0A830CCL7_9LAMI|nr:pentatricopeptide repeat-containing protein at5g46460 mitochondrial [Phtheirospermum japonicum]
MPVRDIVVWNVMIKGCVNCGNLDIALKLFDEMPERNVVSWTTMIDGLLKHGMIEEAKQLFRAMPAKDTAAWNAMVHGLFANGRINEAIRLFDAMPSKNVISWTTMISGLDHHGRSDDALLIFQKMVRAGLKPTSSTYSCTITGCANVGDFSLGSQVHGHVLKHGYVFDVYIAASIITFYANCKRIEECVKAFDENKLHEEKNVVMWTALLTGYGANARHEHALSVFRDMIRLNIIPNQSSFTSALNSSREIETIDWGKCIHGLAIKLGLENDPFVGNSLIVLYTKCGNIKDGVLAFDRIERKNLVTWNAIIVGCAQHGCGGWALAFFTRMAKAGVYPDEITFTGLLTSCSHSGMLEKGEHFFKCISRFGNLETKLEHYACMVDILCRNGKLEKAEGLVEKMPMEANLSIWLALLSGCRSNSNVDVAERAAKNIFLIDPHCGAAYVLLSNIYAFSGKWGDVARIRREMKRVGTLRQPGRSWVVLRGTKHSFVSGDKSHPSSGEIYEKLGWLGEKMKENGYVSDRRFALHDVGDEQREVLLSYHSERLAICFALISGVEGGVITVMKNLRTCSDCHSAIKVMSTVVGREIVHDFTATTLAG